MAINTLKKLVSSSRRHPDLSSHKATLLSSLGAGLCIFCMLISTSYILDAQSTTLIVASMGASAVLVFSLPQGALSRPWPVFGGHVISALIGISCYKYIPFTVAAAGLSVGISVGAMIYMRCLHPPGGATALMAVTGAESIHQLGFGFIVMPIMTNVILLLAFAFIFNKQAVWLPAFGKDRVDTSEIPNDRRPPLE